MNVQNINYMENKTKDNMWIDVPSEKTKNSLIRAQTVVS